MGASRGCDFCSRPIRFMRDRGNRIRMFDGAPFIVDDDHKRQWIALGAHGLPSHGWVVARSWVDPRRAVVVPVTDLSDRRLAAVHAVLTLHVCKEYVEARRKAALEAEMTAMQVTAQDVIEAWHASQAEQVGVPV